MAAKSLVIDDTSFNAQPTRIGAAKPNLIWGSASVGAGYISSGLKDFYRFHGMLAWLLAQGGLRRLDATVRAGP